MLKPNRIVDHGSSLIVEYGVPCRSGTATIYLRSSFSTGKFEEPEINWSCVGSLPIERAEEFLAIFKAALAHAKRLKKTKTGKKSPIEGLSQA